MLYSHYESNRGKPISVIEQAFLNLSKRINKNAHIVYSCATGYGENLIREACNLHEGEVETVAHYYAAKYFKSNVDCILDIGGQDMKCIKIQNGAIDEIVLNEACSSGCGSFIENFANSLGYSAEEFANISVHSREPIDLGTRCTVFMNSNVKQAQKEGCSVNDIASGLAYSVIKNAIYKVLKVNNPEQLGKNIVVQGGTFCNDAILGALEKIIGINVIRPEISELMGAFGAALIARERYSCASDLHEINSFELSKIEYKSSTTNCKGCNNSCRISVNKFSNGNIHIAGNRCENGIAFATGKTVNKSISEIPNLYKYKNKRIFDYEPLDVDNAFRGTIGIPRALNMYEDFPFWEGLFKTLGFRVVLSPVSNRDTFKFGMDSIPSESECYPAKLVHGHIKWLISKGIKTIFYPCILYANIGLSCTQNNYNCPMVISYPENIKNNMDEIKTENVRLINPFLTMESVEKLSVGLEKVIKEEFNIEPTETKRAIIIGWENLQNCRSDIEKAGKDALNWIEKNNGHGIVLAGRPYHLDPEVNHGIPDLIEQFGYAILTEDSVSTLANQKMSLRVTDQWIYHSRLYRAASFVSTRNDVDLVQLNSFGCGLDAVTTDQVKDILLKNGKLYTLLKIDEVSNLGAARIRMRSLFAAIKMRSNISNSNSNLDYKRTTFTKLMQKKKYTLLCPKMSLPHFDLIQIALKKSGYDVIMLENEGQEVIDCGLKYVNNDACYPAIIVIGQMMDAILSGKYDLDRLGVLMSQTGGGCRASNYVGFIRKALDDAGLSQIPVISVNLNGMEKSPGFKIKPMMLIRGVSACLYGDLLSHLLHSIKPYEKIKGTTDALYSKWMNICKKHISSPITGLIKNELNCRKMIDEFSKIETTGLGTKKKVGIVGEVLVKFMPMANNHLTDYLESEGAEAVVPNLIDFFKYCVSSSIYRGKYLGKSKFSAITAKLTIDILSFLQKPIYKKLGTIKNISQPSDFKEVKKNSEIVLQAGNQCGEGWYLAGEMIELNRSGVNNIICLQPFGCLPNHIVGKGVIKKIKEIYPKSNIIAIDYDPSASKVNQINRVKLLLES